MISSWIRMFMLAGLLLSLTGCWNRREMNELAITVGMGIDKAEHGYRVSVQIVDPGEVASKKGGSARSTVTVFQAVGNSIFEALRKITEESPRKLYHAHLRIFVLGESLSRSGIAEALDFISRDHELRTDFFIVVSKGSEAQDILKVLTPLADVPAEKMYSSLETAQKAWAPATTTTLDNLITDLTSEGKEPVLTSIKVTGNKETGAAQENVTTLDPSARLYYSGLALFKKDKLIGWFNEVESKGYNYVVDKVENSVGSIPCPDGGKLTIEVIRSKTEVKGQVIDGNPVAEVYIRNEDNIGEVHCHIDLTDTQQLAALEKLAEKQVKELAENSIRVVQQKYRADVFGFGEVIHRSNPKEWERLKQNWDEHFANMRIVVKSDVKIRRLGTIGNSFIEEIKEK
ncbi:Ger(x)C family spore germination protein [Paenibacillus sp. TAB 01]|uniref:Ger(x)C family spore germination protein n=1 Tax=Paenibacillus sp. TAB 01 TaxID=3368988 RepID=UPI003751C8B1